MPEYPEHTAAPLLASHAVTLVFPFKHRFESGWTALQQDTLEGFSCRRADLQRLYPQGTASRQQPGAWAEPALSVLNQALLDRLAQGKTPGKPGVAAPLWHAEAIPLSDDFYPFIKGMLGAQAPARDQGNAFEGEYQRFALEQALLNALNARLPRPEPKDLPEPPYPALRTGLGSRCGLALSLGNPAAKRRLNTAQAGEEPSAPQEHAPSPETGEEAPVVGIIITAVSVSLSRTRCGQLVIELKLQAPHASPAKSKAKESPLAADVLVEALHALGRAPKQQGRSARLQRLDSWGALPLDQAGKANADVSFTLRDLALSLIAPLLDEPPHWERLFSYVAAAFVENVPDESNAIRTWAKRFARRQTEDYALGERVVGVEHVQPFDTICHAASIEGGAAVVSPRGVAFLEQFVNHSAKQVYTPLALIACREYHVLLRLSQNAAIPIEHGEYAPRTISSLAQLRDHLYNFRLAHHFSTVSAISLHNAVSRMWRKAMDTERLLQDLNNDVLSAVTYLNTARREIFEKRFGAPALIIAAGVAFSAANTATNAVLRALQHAWCPDGQHLCAGFDAARWDALIAYVPPLTGVVLAALVFGIGFLRKRIGISSN